MHKLLLTVCVSHCAYVDLPVLMLPRLRKCLRQWSEGTFWGHDVGAKFGESEISSRRDCCPIGFWRIAFWPRHRTETKRETHIIYIYRWYIEKSKRRYLNILKQQYESIILNPHLFIWIWLHSWHWFAWCHCRIHCPYLGVRFLQTRCGASPRLAQSARQDRWLHSRFCDPGWSVSIGVVDSKLQREITNSYLIVTNPFPLLPQATSIYNPVPRDTLNISELAAPQNLPPMQASLWVCSPLDASFLVYHLWVRIASMCGGDEVLSSLDLRHS